MLAGKYATHALPLLCHFVEEGCGCGLDVGMGLISSLSIAVSVESTLYIIQTIYTVGDSHYSLPRSKRTLNR